MGIFELFKLFLLKTISFFVITIRAMTTAAFTAITTAQMILLRKNDIAFRSFVKVAFLEFLGVHLLQIVQFLVSL